MILTTINGIPLYSTIAEALQWAQARGLQGYHTHTFQNQTGYMGGFTHSTAINSNTPTPRPTINSNTPTPQTTSTSSSSGGGGGY